MFLNIITPCSRPENLHKIAKTINIPTDRYRWLVVFDMDLLPDIKMIPENCETYLYRNPKSTVGHAQRNYAIELITNGHIYMNDDDTTIHPELWDNIKNTDADFISFSQSSKNNSIRLIGDSIQVGKIDSHNFIVSRKLVGNSRWIINKYDADGYFAQETYNKVVYNSEFKKLYIPKVLSVYNNLR
jgi:hypothetical protein